METLHPTATLAAKADGIEKEHEQHVVSCS